MSILSNPEPSTLALKLAQRKHAVSWNMLMHRNWLKELLELLDETHTRLHPWIFEDRRFDHAYIAVPNAIGEFEIRIQGPASDKTLEWNTIRGLTAERDNQFRLYDDVNVIKYNIIYELSDEEYQEIISVMR